MQLASRVGLVTFKVDLKVMFFNDLPITVIIRGIAKAYLGSMSV